MRGLAALYAGIYKASKKSEHQKKNFKEISVIQSGIQCYSTFQSIILCGAAASLSTNQRRLSRLHQSIRASTKRLFTAFRVGKNIIKEKNRSMCAIVVKVSCTKKTTIQSLVAPIETNRNKRSNLQVNLILVYI